MSGTARCETCLARWCQAVGWSSTHGILGVATHKPWRRLNDDHGAASASTHDVVVSHGEITFEKKVIIFWIEDSLINVIAGERSDAVARIPK